MRKLPAVFIILLFFFSFSSGWNPPDHFVKAYVVKVIDGDTIKVKIPKTTFNNRKTLKNLRFTVRLIGIDTPESKPNPRAKLQARQSRSDIETIILLGKLAYRFTKKLAPEGSIVYLEFDIDPQDKYGRLLAYVWLPDGRMLNKEIICNGYAYLLTVPPNIKYLNEFRKCFRYARENGLGLWR